MGFTSYVKNHEVPDLYYSKDFMKWIRKSDGVLVYDFSKTRELSKELREEFIKYFVIGGRPQITGVWSFQQALSKGPKIIRLNSVDFEVLEHMDIRLKIADYSQPFPTCVVEFPEEYMKKKEVIDPAEGSINILGSRVHESKHHPVFAIVSHLADVNAIIVSIGLSSYDLYNTIFHNEEMDLEECIENYTIADQEAPLITVMSELVVYRQVIRAALNACMFVMDAPQTHTAPENPNHHRRLQHFVDTARKSKDSERLNKAERELRRHPIVYTIDQNIKLFAKPKQHNNGTGDGSKKRPHWRRGHVRMQRCGIGLTETKRVRIAPIFVNRDLFLGDEKNIKVTYND